MLWPLLRVQSARVYRVDAQLRNIEALEPFASVGQAMAIADAWYADATKQPRPRIHMHTSCTHKCKTFFTLFLYLIRTHTHTYIHTRRHAHIHTQHNFVCVCDPVLVQC